MSIIAKELIPVFFSCVVWVLVLQAKKVLFQCDNQILVVAISKGSKVTRMLRCPWFFVAYFNIDLHVEHIPDVKNTTADQLSRNYMNQVFSYPFTTPHPHSITVFEDYDLPQARLDITALQQALHKYYNLS